MKDNNEKRIDEDEISLLIKAFPKDAYSGVQDIKGQYIPWIDQNSDYLY